ncbi:hypothetical protein BG011_000282 [Mortierella polycephala]|uniref:F-box domain-containing protein n=1 Tax=Mortierella polycephala TaxID=41804 RepID=A0A9P6Q9D0_9FUNG|nr:hypothetical protein BG011_000282 [Mortierella polycephala]
MPESFFDIPELVDQLSSLLSPQNLFQCIQVSQQWNTLFIPRLWHTINDNHQAWGRIFEACAGNSTDIQVKEERKNWTRLIFAKYGHHIRDLTVEWDIVMEAVSVSGVCVHLQSFIVNVGRYWLDLASDPWTGDPAASLAAARSKAVTAARIAAANAVSMAAFAAMGLEVGQLAQPFGNMPVATVTTPQVHDVELTQTRELTNLPGDLGVHTYDRHEARWMLIIQCWGVIRSNPGLHTLHISHFASFLEREAAREFVYDTLRGLKELRNLQASAEIVDSTDFWKLAQVAPKVETFGGSLTRSTYLQFGTERPPEIRPGINTAIKSLNLRCNVKTLKLSVLLCLLPNLAFLEFSELGENPGVSDEGELGFPSSIVIEPSLLRNPLAGENLKTLHIRQIKGHGDQLANILRTLPNLTELGVDRLGESVSEAIVAHCKKIEVVKAVSQPWYIHDTMFGQIAQDTVNDLLVGCPTLKVIDLIEHYILADEFARRPWACQGLEVFRCRIVGIERLDSAEQEVYDRVTTLGYSAGFSEAEEAIVNKFQRGRMQQRQVYDRLASFPNLEVLDLGYENRNPWAYKGDGWYKKDGEDFIQYGGPITDTMELSLESGLDRLGALKGLKMFGFEAVDHRIGVKELEWMASSWPRLELMYGLDKDRLMNIEYDHEKAALREYMQRLRPDVKHDSLFEDFI